MEKPKVAEQLSLETFFETVHAFHRTAALKAAIELDIFSAIGEGTDTSEALAARCQASEKGTRILCDFLTISGLLKKTENRYALTPDSEAFLDRRSPAYVGQAIEFLLAPAQVEAFRNLATAVRKGGTTLGAEGLIAPEHPLWVDFARAMAPLMKFPAEALASLLARGAAEQKVLDIATGHGLYGIAIGKHNAKAIIVGLDWPNVLKVAEENAQAAGLIDRYRTIAGSAFDVDYGEDFDLILLPNFLHHFDALRCNSILEKVYAALKPGGRAVIVEFIPDENRVSPPTAVRFALMMLAATPAGDAYTYSQYERMLKQVGFVESTLHPLPPTFFRVVIANK